MNPQKLNAISRSGKITAEEFDEEREFYQKNFKDLVIIGKYIPL